MRDAPLIAAFDLITRTGAVECAVKWAAVEPRSRLCSEGRRPSAHWAAAASNGSHSGGLLTFQYT
jgi:hypothetical protein